MTEDKVYNLRELREIFRERMREEDFCIGEDKVEKLFRELLNESEPIVEHREVSEKDRIRSEEIHELFKQQLLKHGEIYEQDNPFYTYLKRRK